MHTFGRVTEDDFTFCNTRRFPIYHWWEAFDVNVLQRRSLINSVAVSPLRLAVRKYAQIEGDDLLNQVISPHFSLWNDTCMSHRANADGSHVEFHPLYLLRKSSLVQIMFSSHIFIKLKQKQPCIPLAIFIS
jgi:hypothetical protein